MAFTQSADGMSNSFADEISRRYNVAQSFTSELKKKFAMLAETQADKLLYFASSNDLESRMKVAEDKDNYKILEMYEESTTQMLLKAVRIIHNSSAEEIMSLLCASSSHSVQDLYSDLFGNQFGESVVLFNGRAATVQDSTSSRNMMLHWLSLMDVKPNLPLRDFVFLRYHRVTNDQVHGFRGVVILQSVDLPDCPPFFDRRRMARCALHDCGFVVESLVTENDTKSVRVTVLTSAVGKPGDRAWQLQLARVVREIPSAIINRRIRLNQFADKKKWDTRDNCALCTSAFSIFRRQHHCRICGVSICSKCCSMRRHSRTQSAVTRVCLSCLNGESTGSLWSKTTRRCHPAGNSFSVTESPAGAGNSIHQSFLSDAISSRHSMQSESSRGSLADGFESLLLAPQKPSIDALMKDVTQNTPINYSLTYNKGNPWPDPPMTTNEDERIRRIQSLNLSQSYANTHLKELIDLARTATSCPVAAVAVVTASTSLLVTAVGLAGDQLPRAMAFEAHTIMSKSPLVVLETNSDERFSKNHLVVSMKIRFYMGVPLITNDGIVVGSLSLGDVSPRESVSGADLRSVQRIAARIMAKLDAKNEDKQSPPPPQPQQQQSPPQSQQHRQQSYQHPHHQHFGASSFSKAPMSYSMSSTFTGSSYGSVSLEATPNEFSAFHNTSCPPPRQRM